jgi:hypothetical protein
MASVWEMLVPGLGAAIQKGLDLIPDPNEKAQAEATFNQLALSADMQSALAQVDLNKAEASSGSLFQGGWRPFVGWTCGAGLVWQYIVGPFLGWVSAAASWPAPPVVDMSALFPLLTAMLGLGALRTYERAQGVAAGQGPASREAAITTKLKTSTTLVQR